jgi:outer membrane protein assembly factor BamB
LLANAAEAKPFIVRLVCSDQPDRLVSDVETRQAKESKEPKEGEKPPPPSLFVTWMRFITLDGSDAFKITYKGAFLKRSAVITADLAEGEHLIQPGEHRFAVRDGRIVSDDPDLRAAGDGLDILCYPVTFVGVDASVVRKCPLKLRRIPLDVIVRHGEDMILPAAQTFDPLVLYMVSNAAGQPYRANPTGQAFRVTREGVRTVDTDEAKAALSGVSVENSFTVGIPSFSFPLKVTTRSGHKLGVKVYGLSGEEKLLTREDVTKTVRAFYSKAGSQIRAGHALANEPLALEGDVAAFPHRQIRVDAREPSAAEPRVLVAAWKEQAFKPGDSLAVRVQYQDSADCSTLNPAEVAVFLRERPVLRDDGSVDYPEFGQEPPPDRWQRLQTRQAAGQPIFHARIPERPTSIYLCRLVVDGAGAASPDSLLSADFNISISAADKPGTLSVFTDSLRSAYLAGETLEFNVVLKNRQPVRGTLDVALKSGTAALPLARQEIAEDLSPGHHTFTFRIAAESTAMLAQGDYDLQARLGGLASNPYRVFIRQPVPQTHFPIFQYSWGGCHPARAVATRETNPVAREFELRRNLRRLANMNMNVVSLVEWLDFYELRESNTLSAAAEQMMRQDLGMPTSELSYSRTLFEILQDEMVRLGQRHFPQSYMSAFGFRSLKHSIEEDRLLEMRHYSLMGQDYRRYPNFVGFLTPKDQVCVLGNSETGDPRWEERQRVMAKNFVARYGHEVPREDQVVKWFQGDAAARERLAQVETHWMHWIEHINGLLPGLQRDIRAAVAEFKPDVKIGAMTSNWFSAVVGEHIARMHAEMDVNYCAVGFGDYARRHPEEEIVETMMARVIGFQQPQWRNMSEWPTKGQAMAKAHFFKSLMGDVDGFGYYSSAGELGIHSDDWRYNEYKEFNDWLRDYGDWYQSLELETPIAVYFSYLDSAHELHGVRDLTTTRCLAMGAVYELIRAHRIAPMIDEERVRQGDLRRYRIVILPGVRLMPDDVRTRLEAFVREGGVVLADEDTTVEIEGAKRIPKNFQAMLYPYQKIGEQYDGNRIFWEAYKRTRGEVAKLNEILRPFHQPFADAESSRVMTSTLRHGDARYVIVVNDEQPYWSEYDYFGVQRFILPNKAQIRLRDTESVIYSLFEGKTVDGRKQDGVRLLDVDFEFSGVQVYALLPRAIGALEIAASGTVEPGKAARVTARVRDAAGNPLSVAVPFELKILDSGGRTVYEVYRTTTAQGFEEAFPVGMNAPQGKWRIEARERFAGHTASVELAVGGDAPALKVEPAGKVIVTDGAGVKRFLQEMKKSEDGLWILLSTDQSLRLAGLAARCAEGLKALGIKAEVKRIDDPCVIEATGRITHSVARHAYEQARPTTHIRRHVVLLGLEGENQLVEEICETPILLRRLTRNYPGDGNALVQLAFSPFAALFRAVLVLANDQAGLERGVDRLLEFESFDQEPDLLRVASVESSASPLRASSASPAEPVPDTIAAQEGVPVSTIAFSPEGDVFAVGCEWYFHNLHLFTRDGKLLWRAKVGRKDIYHIALSPGAERICVATDQGTYLLNRNGEVFWRLNQRAILGPKGDILFAAGTDLTLALRPDGSLLWKDDPWLTETDPWRLNHSSNLEAVGFLKDGGTVVVRNGMDIEYRNVETNEVLHRFAPEALVCLGRYEPKQVQKFTGTNLRVSPDGQFVALVQAEGDPNAFVFRKDGTLVQDAFLSPPYYSDFRSNDRLWLSPDGRLFVLSKDTVYAVAPDGKAAWQHSFNGPLVSGGGLSPDGKLLALAGWNGELRVVETASGNARWSKPVGEGAEVAFSSDGQSLVVGTKNGVVYGFDLDGKERFRFDLRPGSFIPNIEDWWANRDRTVKQLDYGLKPPWHEVVQRDVPLSANLLGLEENRCAVTDTLTVEARGDKLGTYLLAAKFRTKAGTASFRIDAAERDEEEKTRELCSATLQAKPFPEAKYWLFKLSDRPRLVQLRVERQSGESELLFDDLRLQKLAYPSENYLVHRGAYRDGKTAKVMENAPVSAGIYHMQWGSHTVVWADPFYLMDGHVFETQKELDGGWWFGGPIGQFSARTRITPCAMDIEFPEPKPISHIALFDDRDGEPTERVCFQAWVEARDFRKDKTEAEERQIKPGYWRTVGKGRWNRDPFQVFKFDGLVTNKIRFWYLRGPLRLDEIEIYGPEERKTEDWFDLAWLARIPVKVNKPAELAEVEFQPLGLTQPDGSDLRVVSPAGKAVPHVLKQLSPAGSSALAFQSNNATGTFYLYLGNDEANPETTDWRPKGAIWMESYSRPQTVDGQDTRSVWAEAMLLKFYNASKAQALLGAEVSPLDDKFRTEAKFDGKTGVRVLRVFGKPPEQGLALEPNDILLRLDGQELASTAVYYDLMARCQFHQQVELAVSRKGQEIGLKMALGPSFEAGEAGKPKDSPEARAGYVRAVGLDALPDAITRYVFYMQSEKPQKLSFLAELNPHAMPRWLRLNGKTVIEAQNTFEPDKPLPEGTQAVWKRWGDADLTPGENCFEFTFIGHRDEQQFAPLTFRLAETRAERILLLGRHTCFPGALRSEPERMQLLAGQELGPFYLSRAKAFLEKDRLFDAQEMLLYAVRFSKDPKARAEAKGLAAEVGSRVCATNWTMLRRTPSRTGSVEPSPRPGQDALPAELKPFQQRSYQERAHEQLESGIIATDIGTFFGDCFHRIRRAGGWSFMTGGIIRGTPLVYGQRVYCGSVDGKLYCLTASQGELVWQFPTGDAIISSPVVVDDKLLFGSLDGYLYCLDPIDGVPVWKYRTGGWVESSPATDGTLVFAGSYDDNLHAVDLQTGRASWTFKTGFDVRGTPCVENGVVYFGSDDEHVYALKAADGGLVWKAKLNGYLPSGPALAKGVLVVGCHDHFIYGLDAATGGIRWKRETGDTIDASPAIIGDQVYVPSNDNCLYALDLRNGALLARPLFAEKAMTRSFRCSPAYHRESLWLGGTTEGKQGSIERRER